MKVIPQLMPLCIASLSAGSCGAYLLAGDWKRALYWIAAAVITIAVTL